MQAQLVASICQAEETNHSLRQVLLEYLPIMTTQPKPIEKADANKRPLLDCVGTLIVTTSKL